MLTFLDLFGAPGGLSLGFKMAGFTPLAILDSFYDGLRTYSENFPEVKSENVVNADARSPNIVDFFKKTTGLKKKDVDIIIGGPPCQGFSIAGRVKMASLVREGLRKGSKNPCFIDDPRNSLYKTFVRFVDYFRPKFWVMENVPGMISYKNGWVVRQIIEDFRKIGYKNVKYNVINAADYGTPQKRRRIFFVGTFNNKIEFEWPSKTHYENKGPRVSSKIRRYVSVRDAISDLPKIKLPEKGSMLTDVPIKYGGPISEYQMWAREKSNGIVNNHITRWHRPLDLKIFSVMKQGQRWEDIPLRLRKMVGYSNKSFLDKWKKLSYNRPSWTIVAHLHKDGYMYIHPTQKRTISVREAARLQSFPDHFVFYGSRSSQFKQVGNAVPPLMAKSVGKKILKALSLMS